jgi:hypothetical protein
MHSEDVKIADLIGEHLQTKEKTKIGGGRYNMGGKYKGKRRGGSIYVLSSSQICFLRVF